MKLTTVEQVSGNPDISKRKPIWKLAWIGLLVTLLIVATFAIDSPFVLGLAGYTCAFALFGLSVNLMLGGLGEVPLGQCLFFGLGSYIVAVCMRDFGIPFEIATLLAMVVSVTFATVIGFLTLRLTGAYFSIVSWGLAGVALVAAMNLEITGGPLGIFGFQRLAIGPIDLVHPKSYFAATATILMLALFFLRHLHRSPFGSAIECARQSRHLTQSIGISVTRVRQKTLILSAAIATLAGSLSLPYMQIVTPDVFSVVVTVDALVSVLIGGTGWLFGPVVGAIIFTILPQLLHVDPNVRVLIFSVVIIFVMMLAPGGLHQLCRALGNKFGGSKGAA